MFRSTCVGFVFGVLVVVPMDAAASPLEVHEELLGQKADADPFDKWDTASPDGERVAWRERTAKNWVVKVNGDQMGAEFDKIEWIVFSPDGEHVAYRGKQGKSWVVVVDGKPGSPYREVGAIRFSPDNQRTAYAAKKGKKWIAVADGEEGEAFDDLGSTGTLGSWKQSTSRWLSFSPDNRHLVYPAKRKKKWVMVVDGKEQRAEMRNVFGVLGFVPESQSPVYVGQVGKKGWSVFTEYVAGPEFDIVARPDFSKTAGLRFAYAGARVEKPFMKAERALGRVVVDGVAGPEFEGQPAANPLLAGAIELVRGLRPRLSAQRYGVSSPAVSPDGQHIAYGARRGDGDYVVFLDGDAGPSFERDVSSPSFAPDGRLFYVGVGESTLSLMVDGVKLGEFTWEGVDDCTPTFFSEDGTHSAFKALQGGFFYEEGNTGRAKRRLFVDGQAGPEYDALQLADVTFFSEGEDFHWAYVVVDGNDVSFVVVDGLETKRYDRVLSGTLRFADSKTVAFTAQQDRSFYRVTHALPLSPPSIED